MRVPLYEAVPIELVMSQCWVMDLNTYCKVCLFHIYFYVRLKICCVKKIIVLTRLAGPLYPTPIFTIYFTFYCYGNRRFTNLFIKLSFQGRPVGASEEHVYICELRVDRSARLFTRVSRPKYPLCTKPYAFDHFPTRLKLTRTYAVSLWIFYWDFFS